MSGEENWNLVITGCGTSHGNPAWGYPEHWSTDPKDNRRRAGGLIQGPDGQVILIDCGPDFMHQMRNPWCDWDGLSYPTRCITRCDGLLLTHAHADHSHGLNDLRHLNRLMGKDITVYGLEAHLNELRETFSYSFGATNAYYSVGNPLLRSHPLPEGEAIEVAGLEVTPWLVDHGPAGMIYAYKLGKNVGYITDAKRVPAPTRDAMRHLDLLVVNMLQEKEHVTHMNWQECRELLDDLQPKRAVLTHMGYSVRWADWQERLPDHVDMAYDGWEASFRCD